MKEEAIILTKWSLWEMAYCGIGGKISRDMINLHKVESGSKGGKRQKWLEKNLVRWGSLFRTSLSEKSKGAGPSRGFCPNDPMQTVGSTKHLFSAYNRGDGLLRSF